MSSPTQLTNEESASGSLRSELERDASVDSSSLQKASPRTETPAGTTDQSLSITSLVPSPVKPGADEALESGKCEVCDECISIWTWRTCGLPLGGFVLAFLNATAMGINYGFFLGYMGLDSYVYVSITALMKLPQVFLLPLGMMNDCFPICGYHRKPYFVASFVVCGSALLALALRPMSRPFYCQHPDGTYNWGTPGALVPPCNPDIQDEKNWYVWPLFVLIAGVQMGCVAGEGLLLEYSQREPVECRGKMKAEFTVVTMAGSLVSSAFIGIFMNHKEYMGTFDWGLSFRGTMMVCLVIAMALIPISAMCVYEPKKPASPAFSAHIKSSWNLVKSKSLSCVLIFAFVVQLLSSFGTTAGPMVRSQWVGVRVLQQQMSVMGGMFVMMLATWIYKVYLLQACWRKALLIATVTVTISDCIPTFLAVFNIFRNQYFYLAEEIVGAIPTTALALVLNLMVIELSEPGREGLCYGLIGSVMHSSQPVSTAVGNQVFGLFQPKLSKLENYLADTPAFRKTVAWSYVLAYSVALTSVCALPLIPRQKADAQRRKKEWSASAMMATCVLGIPALCLPYGMIVLVLSSQPETACLRWIGGPGCA